MNPRISVIMSVYNAENIVSKSIDSILNQSFTDFEFIIINDASTDDSLRVLNSYEDTRIKLIANKENLGLTKSLNKGLAIAKGEFIARMDADDESVKDRLKKQIEFLDSNSYAFCGSRIKTVDEAGNEIPYFNIPISSDIIKATLFFKNVFAHPTLMIKTSVIKGIGGYDEEFRFAQDYRLLLQLLLNGYYGVNIPDSLLIYKVAASSISQKHSERQKYFASRAIQKSVNEAFGLSFGTEDISRLREALVYNNPMSFLVTLRCLRYMKKLYNHYQLLFNEQTSAHKELRQLINRVIDSSLPSILQGPTKKYVYMGTGFNK